MSATPPEVLQRILGPEYELGRRIGAGGSAEVFAVRDLRQRRELAVKVLRPDQVAAPAAAERFLREARVIAGLTHPHVVPVIRVGAQDGVHYLVMPLVRGESLEVVLRREGPLAPAVACRILREAAAGLAAVHRMRVVHRDVKPANLLLEEPGRTVRVMDFGIARRADREAGADAAGTVVGTPEYMSPEQVRGDADLDHRADQYGLATVGYEMLAGRPPHPGTSSREVMAKQLLEPAPLITTLVTDLPQPLALAIHRGLEKDRARRYESIEAFARAVAGGDPFRGQARG